MNQVTQNPEKNPEKNIGQNQQLDNKIFVSVRLPVALDKEFTYLSRFAVEVGNLVLVEFRRKNYWAAVVEILSQPPKELESSKIKEVVEVNALLKLTTKDLQFISELAAYNLADFGLVLRSFIGNLKIKPSKKEEDPQKNPKKIRPQKTKTKQINSFEQIIDPAKFCLKKLRPKQEEIFSSIASHLQNQKLQNSSKNSPSNSSSNLDLNQSSNQVFLLDGATGSGKTEIYFATIAKILTQKPEVQILVLMPEIALTSQILTRFSQQFGFSPALWHSKISAKQKNEIFFGIIQGSVRVLIGARSALLLPFKNLGMVIIDEEHDQSFKQEDIFNFHARDMAILRGKIENFPVLLSSASPSIESFYNVEIGKFSGFLLDQSEGSKSSVELIDMRNEGKNSSMKSTKSRFISQKLYDNLAANLVAGKQSLLFLNRRGYAPLCLCKKCGQKYGCPNCDSFLVLHKKSGEKLSQNFGGDELICHHCGYHEKVLLEAGDKNICKFCGENDSLITAGIGVEKLKDEIELLFPKARIAVVTSDNIKNFADAQNFIEKVNQGEIDIIIGTQMIAKGYDFENLSLVGIVDADSMLYSCELRSLERAFQLISQVIGRVGRREEVGKVLIQTFEPNNFLFQKVFTNDGKIQKKDFYQFELANRARAHLPPFFQMARFEISSRSEELAKNWSQKLRNKFPNDARIQLFGPATAPVYKIRNRFHFWLHLVLPRNLNLQKLISDILNSFEISSRVRIKTIINP